MPGYFLFGQLASG